jgi:ectoine utilization protein EutC
MDVRILFEREIRRLIGPSDALAAVRRAFACLARGEATLPGVIGLDVPRHRGEVHVKGAHLHGSPFFSIKTAAGFYANVERGLPMASGHVMVFDAETGLLRAILFDNAFLTELRTGSAGALSADLLARRDVNRVALLGYGSQARYQLEALLLVRRPRRVVVWGPSEERAAAAAREMGERFGLPVSAVPTARDAAHGSDLIVTTTPSREPVLRAEWVEPGTHVTAVGSDGPDKQELDPVLLSRADKVVADRLEQCLRLGEIHHAVVAGALAPGGVYGELGELAAGLKGGRASEAEITIADLTGVGIQDAAVADVVVARALEQGLGETLSVP